MAWLAVDDTDYGTEWIFEKRPERHDSVWIPFDNEFFALPQSSIKKLIGRELSWEDEPVEIK